VESSPNSTLLPSHHIYLDTPTAPLVIKMGIYFFGNLQATQQRILRCLYCDQLFDDRRLVNEHYLSSHTEAFSEEELKSARLKHSV
jgi:uncharacterized C2H2 Zn-finger protein